MPPPGITVIGDLFHAGKRGQITVQEQWDWVGRPGRTMTVKGIEDVPVHD